MGKKFNLGRFESYTYDRFHCIRPSLLLLAAMMFLCRGSIASIIAAVTSLNGKSTNSNDLLLVNKHWTTFLAAAPAIAVLCALLARTPNAIGGIRWIWRHGRFLLGISALLQILLLEGPTKPIWKSFDNLSDISLALFWVNILILAYIFFSRQVKDTFADFPAVPSDQKN